MGVPIQADTRVYPTCRAELLSLIVLKLLHGTPVVSISSVDVALCVIWM